MTLDAVKQILLLIEERIEKKERMYITIRMTDQKLYGIPPEDIDKFLVYESGMIIHEDQKKRERKFIAIEHIESIETLTV